MTLDTLVLWIVMGGIAGVLADWLVPRVRLGLVEAIVVGILGAFIGGWLFGQLGISLGGGVVGSILTAVAGAVLLLLVLSGIRRRR
ncbi:MAG TPA: GlsB/YeaQ/YmgE family stress response membrane protein [Anaerolineales bacterium]|nr:GlsB/YeaQ/YmgE family stress response membrane protein [Anaerolineales bacterium]